LSTWTWRSRPGPRHRPSRIRRKAVCSDGAPRYNAAMQTLLHFSEDPNITLFRPHIPPTANPEDRKPMVWAVDDEHAPGFWFPRQSPRACGWSNGKAQSDVGRSLLGRGAHDRMHAVETVWLERLRAYQMYVYRFDAAPFRLYNRDAGYFAAEETVAPL